MNKYRKRGIGVCMLAAFMLVGCGQAKVPEIVNVTSIAVTEEGTVTSYLVDVFDKDYYNISDLASMATEEVAEYNTAHQTGETTPVTLDKVEALADGSGKVVVTHTYDSADTFTDYNEGSVLFYGTVADAVKEGYDLDVVLNSVKDDAIYIESQILQEQDRYVLITDEKAVLYAPKKVTHISENAVYREDGSVDASQAEGTVVILMKK